MQLTKLGLTTMMAAFADKAANLIESLPGFENASWDFKAYSGFLEVPGPINGYDSLLIHYQFHSSQRDSGDPVVVWHNGGPGSSSIRSGLYGEMGAFIIGEDVNYVNPFAWNRVANMLYLDSPAGVGSSQCLVAGAPVACDWDDVSQAEAYANTLTAFFDAFPELSGRDLYLVGESYAGQYIPNIAHFIINNEPFNSTLNLKGISLGNACWGEHEDGHGSLTDGCNGPNAYKNDVEFFFGKGFFSPKLHEQIYEACDFPNVSDVTCQDLLTEMGRQVGPHNTYNVYDNCPKTEAFLSKVGKDAHWLNHVLRAGLHNPEATHQKLLEMNGGFQWDCLGDARAWLARDDVRAALHLDSRTADASDFHYNRAGPSAVSLYPELAKAMRVLIYNGDADACVPFVGNEEWIDGLEEQGVLVESAAWTPWYAGGASTPAGYVTEYSVAGSTYPFWFATIRLAGHEAPTFQPSASFDMFSSWLAGNHLTANGAVKSLVI